MKNVKTIKLFIYGISLPVLILSLFIGPSEKINFQSIIEYINYLLGNVSVQYDFSIIQTIIIDVRMPRIILTFLVGSALSVSGCGLQAIFRNPLVSPYILGLSSGAAFGAALALACNIIPVQVSAFLFGLIAVALSYFTAMRNKTVSIISLILSGIIVSGIFTALLTIIQFISDPFKLQSIVHWTMGNLHNANWQSLSESWIPMIVGIIILFLMRWRLNILGLGDEEARVSGLNPEREKIIILIAATLSASAAVSVAGIIGLYGLIVPHMVRMLVGADNKQLIPLNFFFGGTFLLIIDDFSRTLANFEIPIGVITMLLGAPIFFYLIKKSNIGWEN